MRDSHRVSLFVCYASKDRKHYDELCSRLRALQCIDVLSDVQFKPGEQWRLEISRAIDRADVVVILVSANSRESEHCGHERKTARAKHPECRVIPVYVDPPDDAADADIKDLHGLRPHQKSHGEAADGSSWWADVVDALSEIANDLLAARRETRRRRLYGSVAAVVALLAILCFAFDARRVRAGYVIMLRWRPIEIFESSDELLSTLTQEQGGDDEVIPVALKETGPARLVAATAARKLWSLYWLREPDSPSDVLHIGSGEKRPIGAVVPNEFDPNKDIDCDSLAGTTMGAGIWLFRKLRNESRLVIHDDHDRGDPRKAESIISKLEAARVLAVVGTYESRVTQALMDQCGISMQDGTKATTWPASRCGPLLTLSSAVSLRPPEGEGQSKQKPWMFRMTVNNRSRAHALTEAIDLEQRASSPGAKKLSKMYIIYKHDVDENGKVGYAIDQAYELYSKRKKGWSATLVSFRRTAGSYEFFENPTLATSDGPGTRIISSGGRRMTVDSFGGLIDAMLANDANNVVAFTALDADVVAFARALHGSRRAAGSDIRLYVPGPREIFERDWGSICFGGPYLPALEGVRVVSPDVSNASAPNYQFVRDWYEFVKAQPPSSRAARVYDALGIIEQAIEELERRLTKAGIAEIQRELYQLLLRNEIAHTHYDGASGFISFDGKGDMVGPAYLQHIQAGQLRPLPIYDLLYPASPAAPKPQPAGVNQRSQPHLETARKRSGMGAAPARSPRPAVSTASKPERAAKAGLLGAKANPSPSAAALGPRASTSAP